MILDTIKSRYALRNFDAKMPSLDDIRDILEAGRLAPSWMNIQPWHFIVVKDPNTKQLLYNLSQNQQHVLNAPVIIACCCDLSCFDFENFKTMLEKRPGMTQERLQFILNNKALNPAAHSQEMVRLRAVEELTYAIAYMTLEAHEKGLETCVVGAIGNELTNSVSDVYAVVKEELELPKNVILSSLLLAGYPANPAEALLPKDRKSFDSVVSFEKYSQAQ
ncbi:MAG: nitroreductase family protein [Candidatus Gastranaerophilales bacterium]|nr:nitroreductase family protein [Candidatus Gastranaerophilales bacterium]